MIARSQDLPTTELDRLRSAVEVIDADLIELMARRCQITRAIGEVKRELGVPIIDPSREAMVVRRASALARALGVEEEVVRRIFWFLVELGRRTQLEAPQAACTRAGE